MNTYQTPTQARAGELSNVQEADFPTGGTRREQLLFLLSYAVLAPSLYNAQPWLFAVDDDINMYADRTRALPVADPADRELAISCGAALFNLRIALHHFGFAEAVEVFPDPQIEDLLARIRVQPAGEATSAVAPLFAAIPVRHTSRQPFAARAVPAVLLSVFESSADDEGAWLKVVEGLSAQRALAELIAGAEEMLWEDQRYRREVSAWIHPHPRRQYDGIPGYARGFADLESSLRPFLHPIMGDTTEPETAKPALAILGTQGDTQFDWVAAGQALERVLLAATAEGVSASFFNQPIEVHEIRSRLREITGRPGYPQTILRLGYGPNVSATPRRPLDQVVLP